MSKEAPVKSPCISVCALNEEDLCVGCYRTVADITQWVRMSNDQRRGVLEQCRARARVNNPFAG